MREGPRRNAEYSWGQKFPRTYRGAQVNTVYLEGPFENLGASPDSRSVREGSWSDVAKVAISTLNCTPTRYRWPELRHDNL